MKKVIAFAGSNSKDSINHELVTAVASNMEACEITIIRLTNYDIPLYSEDLEKESGIPEGVQLLKAEIQKHHGVLISVNEHNGSVSAFFKNILDWLSRAERKYLEGRKVLVMSTSPGGRGGKSALEYVITNLPRVGATIVSSFSIPSFQENFDLEKGLVSNTDLQKEINKAVTSFEEAIS